MEPSDEEVARLAEAWEPFASVIEDKITAGWEGMEPPKLVYRVSWYLAEHDPIKAKQFQDRFFKHLN